MNLKKWMTILGLVITMSGVAQDIHFSQFAETPLYRNPALAGIYDGDVRVQAVYRTQWNSIAHAYKTASLNAEYKYPVGKGDDFLTLGMLVFYDRAGSVNLTATHVMPVLNFHKSISNKRNMYLSAGFMGGFVQRRLDPSKITTNDDFDGIGGAENFSTTRYTYMDGGVGLSLNAGIGKKLLNNLVVGVAYHHFNRPKNSFFNDPSVVIHSKLVFSGDIKFDLNDHATMTVQSDYSLQGPYQEMIGGVLYGIKLGPLQDRPDYSLQGGVFYRINDAIIPTVKIDYRPFSVGLSYDINISKLKTSSHGRGGFELSVTYIGFLDRENSSVNAVRCPRF